MANGNTKKARKAKQAKAASSRPRKPRPGGTGLDLEARRYAALLADPCGAPLTHPIYAGGEGGYLVRTESFFTLGTTTTSAHVVHWSPGSANSLKTELIIMSAADGATSVVLGTNPAVATPGRDFLTNNVSMYRCVAACMRIGYNGSESTRAGRIHYGRTITGLLNTTDSVTADGVANNLPHYTRTPPTEVEVLWTPADADQLFVDPNTSTTVDQRRRGAITVALSATPQLTGVLTFRMTAIYEWQPKTASGLAVAYESRAQSSATLDQVLNFVGRAVNVGRQVGGFIGDMARIYGMQPSYGINTVPQLGL